MTQGKRTNTRTQRLREKLIIRRQKLIEVHPATTMQSCSIENDYYKPTDYCVLLCRRVSQQIPCSVGIWARSSRKNFTFRYNAQHISHAAYRTSTTPHMGCQQLHTTENHDPIPHILFSLIDCEFGATHLPIVTSLCILLNHFAPMRPHVIPSCVRPQCAPRWLSLFRDRSHDAHSQDPLQLSIKFHQNYVVTLRKYVHCNICILQYMYPAQPKCSRRPGLLASLSACLVYLLGLISRSDPCKHHNQAISQTLPQR